MKKQKEAKETMASVVAEMYHTATGGETVPDEIYFARLEVCRACEKFGRVRIMGMVYEGCTVCGCPAVTKLRAKTYFSLSAGEMLENTCPHPDGDKWASAGIGVTKSGATGQKEHAKVGAKTRATKAKKT